MTNLMMVFGMYVLTGLAYLLAAALITMAVLWRKFGIDNVYNASMRMHRDVLAGEYGNAWLSNMLLWPYRYTRNSILCYDIISDLCENER